MGAVTKMKQEIVSSLFFSLSILGFVLLWVVMAYNGTLSALLRAAWQGKFADGRSLRKSYTRLPPLDFAITVLVAFFDDQINAGDAGTWHMMLNFLVMLQAPALWIFVEAGRESRAQTMVKLHFLWPLLWNCFGAAIVLPLYFYQLSQHPQLTTSEFAVADSYARYCIPILISTGYIPTALMLYVKQYATVPTQQATIACCLVSPLLVLVIAPTRPNAVLKNTGQNNRSRNSAIVCYAYLLAGLISASIYLYTVVATLTSVSPDIGLWSVFVPAPSTVAPEAADKLHRGALLFLQYDWIIVNISCALWINFVTEGCELFLVDWDWRVRLSVVALATLVTGPGAAGSGAMWLREQKLSLQANRQRPRHE